MNKNPRMKAMAWAGLIQLALLLGGLVTALVAVRLPSLHGQPLPVAGGLAHGYALCMAVPMAWAALVFALHGRIRRSRVVFVLMLAGSVALAALFAVLDGYLLAELFRA